MLKSHQSNSIYRTIKANKSQSKFKLQPFETKAHIQITLQHVVDASIENAQNLITKNSMRKIESKVSKLTSKTTAFNQLLLPRFSPVTKSTLKIVAVSELMLIINHWKK